MESSKESKYNKYNQIVAVLKKEEGFGPESIECINRYNIEECGCQVCEDGFGCAQRKVYEYTFGENRDFG